MTTAFTSSASSHAFSIKWRVEVKDGPKAKWREVSTHADRKTAEVAERFLKQDGVTVRIRAGV
jgi:hypothetical protein